MPKFTTTLYNVSTGSSANTFKTLIGLKAANTTGHRGELRSIDIGGAGGAPQDLQCGVRVAKTGNSTDGTSTSMTPVKKDKDSIASVMTGGENYTAEPTTVGDPLWEDGFNTRGSVGKSWPKGEGPKWGQNETLVIQAAPGEATAAKLAVTIEWDED